MKVLSVSHEKIKEDIFDFVNTHINELENTRVVAIASGGNYFAKLINAYIGNSDDQIIYLKCQRPSTNNKRGNKLLRVILRIAPVLLKNIAKNIEHYILMNRRNDRRSITVVTSSVIKNSREFIIVDDAIDSGVTMLNVINFIKKEVPESYVLTYAYVITSKRPVVFPDYFTYRNVLIRFPWSMDAQ